VVFDRSGNPSALQKRLMNGYGNGESGYARRRVANEVIGDAEGADYINRSAKAQEFSVFAITRAVRLATVFL
jgi:hypothetical protein